jgi:Fe-S-cluster containining protein
LAATRFPPRVPRPQVKLAPGQSLCDHCVAKCCRYFALPIDTPETREEFDLARWYLLHEHATIFTEGKTWYLLVYTECRHLQSDLRCGIYETRPQICRDYSTVDCEYEDDTVYDQYFETPEQLEEYAEALLAPRDGSVKRGKRPALLPVLS